MRTRVQQWGNGLAVRIPKPFAEETSLSPNTEVELVVREGSLVIEPVAPKRYTLSGLVSKITPQNRHEEVDFGPSVGNEAWP